MGERGYRFSGGERVEIPKEAKITLLKRQVGSRTLSQTGCTIAPLVRHALWRIALN
jgi:hypothetical protein